MKKHPIQLLGVALLIVAASTNLRSQTEPSSTQAPSDQLSPSQLNPGQLSPDQLYQDQLNQSQLPSANLQPSGTGMQPFLSSNLQLNANPSNTYRSGSNGFGYYSNPANPYVGGSAYFGVGCGCRGNNLSCGASAYPCASYASGYVGQSTYAQGVFTQRTNANQYGWNQHRGLGCCH